MTEPVNGRSGAATLETDAGTEERKHQSGEFSLNPKYSFDTFVVGPSNEAASSAAQRVSREPATAHNPLFLYGGVGLGKTHLLHSIGNSIREGQPLLSVLYVSTETFTNEVLLALRSQSLEDIQLRYRSVDVLLIDDIQFIAENEHIQEELLDLFNTLYEANKQLVLSSDRPVERLTMIADRLKHSFARGAICEIHAPSTETKISILRKRADSENISIPEEIIKFMASNIGSNIRELEGSLLKIAAYTALTGCILNLKLAKRILRDVFTFEKKSVTLDQVINTVADHFGMDRQEIVSKKRTRDVALPRQVAIYIARQLTRLSYDEIGKSFGNRDHSTVIYTCNQVEIRKRKDKIFARLLENMANKLL